MRPWDKRDSRGFQFKIERSFSRFLFIYARRWILNQRLYDNKLFGCVGVDHTIFKAVATNKEKDDMWCSVSLWDKRDLGVFQCLLLRSNEVSLAFFL